MPSYHDLHVTTTDIKRKRIYDMSGYMVTCSRSGAWELWLDGELIVGEYMRGGLCLDVAGHVIVDTLKPS